MEKILPTIEFCNKENDFLQLIGKNELFRLYNDFRKTNNICHCCDFQPNATQFLKMHVLTIDKENPLESKFVLLCDACFYLKHFNQAVEKDMVVLVNSEFTQLALLSIQRESNKTTNEEIKKKTIMILKQKPSEYAKILQEDYLRYSPYIKVLFNNNFKWDKCK